MDGNDGIAGDGDTTGTGGDGRNVHHRERHDLFLSNISTKLCGSSLWSHQLEINPHSLLGATVQI